MKPEFIGNVCARPFCRGKANKLVIPAGLCCAVAKWSRRMWWMKKGGVKLRQVRLGEATADGEWKCWRPVNPGEKVALDPGQGRDAGIKQK